MLTHRLLLPQLLVKNHALLEGNALKDVVCRQMNAAGGHKDAAMCLCLTQQFNEIVSVGCSDVMCLFDGFRRDLHHVPIVPLQRQRVAGDDVVLNNQMHQCLFFVIAIANRAPDLGAQESFHAEQNRSNFFPCADVLGVGKPMLKCRPNNQPCFWILSPKYNKANNPRQKSPWRIGAIALVDDELEVSPDHGLEQTITLVRLLGDGCCVGDAGVKDEAAELQKCKEVRI